MATRAKRKAKKQTSRKSTGKKRAVKKTASKKRVSKKTTSKKTAAKRKTTRRGKAPLSNHDSLWNAYKGLQQRIDVAWKKLQTDVKRNAPVDVITAHKNQLLLLLGECNYMARECMKSAGETESNGFTESTTPIDTDNNPFRNQR
jgi:hypothetical protein